MKDLKYLFAYTVPISAYISFEFGGVLSYTAVFYAFVVLPFLDIITGQNKRNLSNEELMSKKKKWVFDAMLYLNIPLVFGLLLMVFTKIQTEVLATYELIGLSLSAGILLATNAINVAHELGHRGPYIERFMSKCLYMPCLYMHFYIEHNFGHHLKVATPEDGATAKYNQPLYSFWLSSVTRQYISAWKIQIQKLKSGGHYFFSIKNNMLFYHITQPIYLFGIYYLFSLNTMMFSILIGVVSFLLLECINYIEHYGLRRFKTNSNRYERVQPHHSWNSNFNIGRITLYELTRHSDHHYKSSKKYQVLNSHDECPTLPFGYPASILLSFFPPIWFWIMNPRVPKTMKSNLKNS